MKKLLNQRGFGALEMILVVLLLAAIGAAGYFAYQARQADSDTASSKNVTAENPEAKANPYEGWKTFESVAYKGASFRYPTDWNTKVEASPFPEVADGKNVILTSPKGLQLNYVEFIDGLGGGCPDTDPHVNLTTVEELANGSVPPVYFIENKSIIALASESSWPNNKAQVGDTGTCLYYPLVSTNSAQGSQLSFSTSIQARGGDAAPLVADKAELAEARLILKSFKL